MNAVVLSPWPPQRNGIADYAYELTRYANGPVTVVTEALCPRPLSGPVRCLNPSETAAAMLDCTPLLYHFGNNDDHVYLVNLFLRHPGVAVVHDPTLHYLAELADGAMPGFFEALLRLEHPGQAEAMRRLWRQPGMKRALDYQQAPLLAWLGQARAIIVHSRYAARIVQGVLPRVPVEIVPHFAYTAPPNLSSLAAAARARLGIGAGDIVLACAGFATRNKQYDAVLAALASLPASLRARVWLVIGGEARPEDIDIPALAARLGVADRLKLPGYLDEDMLTGLLATCDLLLNLRFPSFGESSGSLARALGLGCLIAVTDACGYAELPDAVCVKLPSRPDPSAELAELITRLAEDTGTLARQRRQASAYAQGELHPGRIAQRYAEIMEAAYA